VSSSEDEQERRMPGWKEYPVYRALVYCLVSLVLTFAPNLAQAASLDEAANTEDFQKGEAFSVSKAMFSIFGNVDEQNRSRFESYTFSAVEWKAFTLNNVETMCLATSGELLNLLNSEEENANPAFTPTIGMHIFEKKDDRWELSLSDKYITDAEHGSITTVDLVKIGNDQVALALTEGLSDKQLSTRWMVLYYPVDGKVKNVFRVNIYDDNRGGCSMSRGPGEVYADFDDLLDMPSEERAAILDTCHCHKTDIYVFPSDSKFYTLKTTTTDTIEWKGPDGKLLPTKTLEYYLRLEDHWDKYLYTGKLTILETEPLIPLFDENSNYKKRRQSLEKSAWDVQ
jgi:hypothetical protein